MIHALNLQPAIFWNPTVCTNVWLVSFLLLSISYPSLLWWSFVSPLSYHRVLLPWWLTLQAKWKILRNLFLRYPLHCSDIVALTNYGNSEYYLRLFKRPPPDGEHNRYRQFYKSLVPSCPQCAWCSTMLLVIVRPKDQDNSITFREVTLWSASSPRDRRHSASWRDSSRLTILVCPWWRFMIIRFIGKRDASHHPIYRGFIGKSSTWVISNILLYITQHDEQNYVLSNTDS